MNGTEDFADLLPGAKPKPATPKIAGYTPLSRTTGDKEKDSLYEQWGKQYDVDPNLLYEQGFQESNFKTNARSYKGALGPAQFMPDTAREFGMRVDDQVDERLDWKKAVPAQAKLMRKLLDRTNDVNLALAGYNSGHNYSIEQLRKNLVNIAETKNYAERITSKYFGKAKSLVAQKDFSDLMPDSSYLGKETDFSDLTPEKTERLPIQPPAVQPSEVLNNLIQQKQTLEGDLSRAKTLDERKLIKKNLAKIQLTIDGENKKKPIIPTETNTTVATPQTIQTPPTDIPFAIKTNDGKTFVQAGVQNGLPKGQIKVREIGNDKGGMAIVQDIGGGNYSLLPDDSRLNQSSEPLISDLPGEKSLPISQNQPLITGRKISGNKAEDNSIGFVAKVNPNDAPAGTDKNEFVFRQASKQLGNKIYNRPLNALEVGALVEKQRNEKKAFVFDVETNKPVDASEGDYQFNNEGVKENKEYLDKIQPQIQKQKESILEELISKGQFESVLELSEQDIASLNDLGISNEEIDQAFTSNPRYETARKTGTEKRLKNQTIYEQVLNNFEGNSIKARAEAAYFTNWIDKQTRDKIIADETQAENEYEVKQRTKDDGLWGATKSVVSGIVENLLATPEYFDKAIQAITDPAGIKAKTIRELKGESEPVAETAVTREIKRQEEIEKAIRLGKKEIYQQFGGFTAYNNYITEESKKGWFDFAGRNAVEFYRNIGRSVADASRSLAIIDKTVEEINPMSVPDEYRVSLRSVGNLMNYLNRQLGRGEKWYVRGDAPVEERQLYKFGDWLVKEMGNDPYLKSTFIGGEINSGVASAIYFLAAGRLLKGVKYGVGMLGVLSQVAPMYDQLRANDVDEATARKFSVVVGTPLGLSEEWGLGGQAERLTSQLGKDLKENTLKTLLGSLMGYARQNAKVFKHEAIEEGLQEWFQSSVGQAAVKAIATKDKRGAEKIKAFFNELPNAVAESMPDAALASAIGGTSGVTMNTALRGGSAVKNWLKTEKGIETNLENKIQPISPISPNELEEKISGVNKRLEEMKPSVPQAVSEESGVESKKTNELAQGQKVNIEGKGEGTIVEDKGNSVIVDFNDGQSRTQVRKNKITPIEELGDISPEANSNKSITLPLQTETPANTEDTFLPPKNEQTQTQTNVQVGEPQTVNTAAQIDVPKPENKREFQEFDLPPKQNTEAPKETLHKFSTTQVDLPEEVSKKVVDFGQKLVDKNDLADDGMETRPHITAKYGLETDEVDDVRKLLEGISPFEVTLGKTSIFPAKKGQEFDVVKIDVDSPKLHSINKLITDNTKNTTTQPSFVPHVTLARVKAGTGSKYAGKTDFSGQKITFDKITFSDRNGNEFDIPLGKGVSSIAPQINESANTNVSNNKTESLPDSGKDNLTDKPINPSNSEVKVGDKVRYKDHYTGKIKEGTVTRVKDTAGFTTGTIEVDNRSYFNPGEIEILSTAVQEPAKADLQSNKNPQQNQQDSEKNNEKVGKLSNKKQEKLDKLSKYNKQRSAPQADTSKHSLSTFVERSGGLKSNGVIDVSAVRNAKGGNFIVGKKRMEVEEAFRNAVEAGYFSDKNTQYSPGAENNSNQNYDFTVDDFVEAVAADRNGSQKYFTAQAIELVQDSIEDQQNKYWEEKAKEEGISLEEKEFDETIQLGIFLKEPEVKEILTNLAKTGEISETDKENFIQIGVYEKQLSRETVENLLKQFIENASEAAAERTAASDTESDSDVRPGSEIYQDEIDESEPEGEVDTSFDFADEETPQENSNKPPTNFLGEEIQPKFQDNLFGTQGTDLEAEKALKNELNEAYGEKTANFLQQLAKNTNPNIARVADDLIKARKLVSAKGEDAAQLVEQAADGLEIFVKSQNGKMSVDEQLKQRGIFDAEISPEGQQFARQMESGKFSAEFNKALSNAKNAPQISPEELSKQAEENLQEVQKLNQKSAEEAENIQTEPITDFGEKIGGARKDTAESGFSMSGKKESNDQPAWMKNFHLGETADGKFEPYLTNDRFIVWRSRQQFDTQEEAITAIKLFQVAQKFRTRKSENGYEIYRRVTDRKFHTIKDGFQTEEEAKHYLVKNLDEFLNYKPTFPERPHIEDIQRTGTDYRNGQNISAKHFAEKFGFSGIEFGNWIPQDERQRLLNMAFDGLMDLADVLGIPARAISLNGQLSIAFGSRGQGLSKAAAHYERSRAVFNLTRMKGAGSVAHEWFHAVDHYLGAQDKGETLEKNEKGIVESVKGRESDFLSQANMYKTKARQAMVDAFKKLIKTIFKQPKIVEVSVTRYESQVEHYSKSLGYSLQRLRQHLESANRYTRKKNPASANQMQRFDNLVKKIEAEDFGEAITLPTKSRWKTIATYQVFKDLNDLITEITGRSELRNNPQGYGQTGYVYDVQSNAKALTLAKVELAKYQLDNKEERTTPTKFYYDAKDIDKMRSSDYWSTNHEMAARAFESFVEDKLKERGDKSQYLVHSTENSIYELLFGLSPYPKGIERQTINQAFDDFFGILETEETNQGVAMKAAEIGEKDEINLEKLYNEDGEIDHEQLKEIAGRIGSGELEISRLNSREEQGRIAGGRRNVEASIIAGTSTRSGQETSRRRRATYKEKLDNNSKIEKALESYAKKEGIWFDLNEFVKKFTYLKTGKEADVFYDGHGSVFKFVDYDYGKHGISPSEFLDNKISLYNYLFPETHYELIGFTRDDNGRFRFILKQRFIQGTAVTPRQTTTYMKGVLGPEMEAPAPGQYFNPYYHIWDLHPGNLLKDENGKVFVIDGLFELNTPERQLGGIHSYQDFAVRQSSSNSNLKAAELNNEFQAQQEAEIKAAQAEHFKLSLIPENELQANKDTKVPFVNSYQGRSFTTEISIADYQTKLKNKESALERLLKCIGG